MLKRYSFWLWVAIVFQFLTAAIHSLSFFVHPVPQNESERLLFDLMQNYRRDLGAGFRPSTANIVNALSSCLTFLYVLGGLTNTYLVRRKTDVSILKGIVGIQTLVLGGCFIVMAFLTFLPPILLTGLTFFFLTVTYFTFPKVP